jgi:hypothetical protein
LIVYSDAKGTDALYTTAYNEKQRRQGIIDCAKRHGTHANVRCVPASKHPVT